MVSVSGFSQPYHDDGNENADGKLDDRWQELLRSGGSRAVKPSCDRRPHDVTAALTTRAAFAMTSAAERRFRSFIRRHLLVVLLRALRRLLRGFMQIEMRRNGFRCSAGQRNERFLCRLFRSRLLRRRCCFRVDPNCRGRDSCGTGVMVERLLLLLRLRLCTGLAFLRCRTLGGRFRCWTSLRPA